MLALGLQCLRPKLMMGIILLLYSLSRGSKSNPELTDKLIFAIWHALKIPSLPSLELQAGHHTHTRFTWDLGT